MDAPAPLEICLLGGFRVAVQGRVVPAAAWRQRRPAAVVKLLALAPGHRLHREYLIETLWPELDEQAAANNLRVAITRARRRLEAAGAASGRFLFRDGEDFVLAAPDMLRVDTESFAAAAAHAWWTGDPATARAALDLYPGDLLLEDLYEDWAANPRTELRAKYLALLTRLAQGHEERREFGRAIATLQRLLDTEPCDEPAHAALMRLFAQVGETRQALTQYDRLVLLLETELGVEPEPATRELAAAIRDGRFPAETDRPAPAPAADQPFAPPAAARIGLAGVLPPQLEELIGRDREVAEVKRLMTAHRLVTLTGPAGVGKTRLALAIAHRAGQEERLATFFIDLSPLRDPLLVLSTIVQGLGAGAAGRQPSLEDVADRFGTSRLLVVLDNFEQVESAAPVVAELLAACAGLHIVVTSRGRLRLRGEQTYPVEPLATPAPLASESPSAAASTAAETLATYPAVALFMRRAREAQPGFILSGGDAATVAGICRRLDGLPLAIELAAARVRVLPPAALLDLLARPLAVLVGGPRDAPARQQTLRAAIAWSHDLLSPAEQRLFARLAVFAGGFPLEAVAAVSADVEAATTLEPISALVEQSLLRRAAGTESTVRFSLLETIREFARERLDASGEAEVTASLHAAYFLTVAERAEPELTGPATANWLRQLDSEHDNLRLALTTLAAAGDWTAALRLAGALWRFWWLRGHLQEGRAWLARALAEGAAAPPAVRAKALDGAGALAAAQGDLDRATALHTAAWEQWQDIDDRHGMARSLTSLGLVANDQGNPQRATQLLEDALVLARQVGDRRGVAVALANLGQIALDLAEFTRAASLLGESVALFRDLGAERDQTAILANLGVLAFLIGDFARAEQCHEEALALLRRLGDRQGEADELLNLGHTVQRRGDLARAAVLFTEALDGFTQLGDRSGRAFALTHLGRLAHLRGDNDTADTLLRESFALGQEIGDRIAAVEALEGLATVFCARGEVRGCARLLGAAAVLRESCGVPLPEVHRADYLHCLATARSALGEEAFAISQGEGTELAREQIGAVPLGLLAGE